MKKHSLGHGTTHNTNGIAIQQINPTKVPQKEVRKSLHRTRKKTVHPPATNIAVYQGGKKEGPKIAEINDQYFSVAQVLKLPRRIDLAYNVTKFDIKGPLPSWTGFNQLLSQTEVLSKSAIGYLPIIDASPTEMNTVLTILQRSVEISKKLVLDVIVVVVDQAIYCKAQIIRWQNAEFAQKIVFRLRLGALHTAMSFLGCIGKRFKDGGLQDLLIEAEIIAVIDVRGLSSNETGRLPAISFRRSSK